MNHPRFFIAIGIAIAVAGCGSRQDPTVPDKPASSATSAEIRRREANTLEGNWALVSFTMAGKFVEATEGSIAFLGNKMIMKAPGAETKTYLYRINPMAEPKSLEMTDSQDTNAPPRFALYELEGKNLRLCLGEGKPPTAFGAGGSRVFLLHRP